MSSDSLEKTRKRKRSKIQDESEKHYSYRHIGERTKQKEYHHERVVCEYCTDYHYRLKGDMVKTKTYSRKARNDHIQTGAHRDAIEHFAKIGRYRESICHVCATPYEEGTYYNHLSTAVHKRAVKATAEEDAGLLVRLNSARVRPKKHAAAAAAAAHDEDVELLLDFKNSGGASRRKKF